MTAISVEHKAYHVIHKTLACRAVTLKGKWVRAAQVVLPPAKAVIADGKKGLS
jgi:hypothetical protein